MPHFEVPAGHTEESYLTMLCLDRLDEIKCTLRDPADYTSRLLYEVETINELGFAGYFLTVRDFVKYAKENDIPVGPGRGSVCGSLVAFLTGITQVDPIRYHLLFERFLSIHRKGSIPDIDLDFASDRREDMFKYAVNKYGKDKCALVSTFGMRKAKASLRDTARVFEIDPEVADEAAKLIPEVYYDEEGEKSTDLSIQESMDIVPRLAELAEEYPEWFELAMKLEDLPRSTSIHAAGTIISPVPLIEYIPLIKSNNENINATALNLSAAEKAGFVKQDFLALSTLSVLYGTERAVGYHFDFNDNEYDDDEVWDLIGSKNTTTLFQIGSKTYKDRMPRLRPRTIEQLAACLALVRGPCISSGADKIYMDIQEGTREVELIHPFYDSATQETNGILLYQEQLMQIAVNFGFELEDSYKLMKAVAKKKKDKIMEFQKMFYDLAAEKRVPDEVTDRVWKIILDAGLYCFNKSHAVAYALLCYQSAFLKTHYPRAYMINALTNAYLRKEEMEETVAECRRLGIRFLGVDVNASQWEFTLNQYGDIQIGFCAIKSFGKKAADEVMSKRPFDGIEDFLEKIAKNQCTKRDIVPAIFSGMFDSFSMDRREMFRQFCEIRREEVPDEIKLQGKDKFTMDTPYDEIEQLLLSASLIYNPVNDFAPIGFDQIKKSKLFDINAVIRKVKKIKDKSDRNMAFLTLETADGNIEATMFADSYAKYKSFCKKNLVVSLHGKKDGEESCIALSIS
jgi:DNA polymerase-3 subunit alpha